jgi:hypothetical protein
MVSGRRYTGTLWGRQVEVRYTPTQSISPALFEAYVSVDTRTRTAFGQQRPLLDCRDIHGYDKQAVYKSSD